MEMNRRSLLVGGAALSLARQASAQNTVQGNVTPDQLQENASRWKEGGSIDQYFFGEEGPPVSPEIGTGNPTANDVLTAFKIVYGTPRSVSPYQVAQYLASRNEVGSENISFRQEWRSKANPLIVSFFAMTQTLPSGDVTPWCAAFVNFCLVVSGREPTLSAASASFRNHRAYPATDSPVEGDLAVFVNTGDRNKGHVAFYVSPPADGGSGMMVLGGNQSDGIKISQYPSSGLVFHSYRRVR